MRETLQRLAQFTTCLELCIKNGVAIQGFRVHAQQSTTAVSSIDAPALICGREALRTAPTRIDAVREAWEVTTPCEVEGPADL